MNSIDNAHFAMVGGDGPHSYVKNSSYQRGVLETAKAIIEEEIGTKLEIRSSTQNAFCIADFGCSTGDNSFEAMHVIIEAIKRKHESSNLKTPQFYVCFNDVVTNDFNTLFGSLPPDRDYGVAAVPGDFHRRLLPPSSLHFAYSSWALMWLTQTPPRDSPAWSGGEALRGGERRQIYDAHLAQFEKDLESFLEWRAVEMADAGLMALLIPGRPSFLDPRKEFTIASAVGLLRSCLDDMAKMGRLSEAKLKSFEFPLYFPTPKECRAILQRSHSFSIERMEVLKTGELLTVDGHVACYRAAQQTNITRYFGIGDEIIDELFELLKDKLVASPVYADPNNDRTVMLLAILKRKNV